MTVQTILSVLGGIFRTNNQQSGPTGANAVRTAVAEIEGLQEDEYLATLGEPRIEETEGQFFNDYRVVVPLNDVPYEASSRLVFDVPVNRNDERSQFVELLNNFDVTWENMEDVTGEIVPVEFVSGHAVVDWSQVESQPGEERDDGDDSDDVTVDAGGVKVEETTISSDDDA